MTKPLEKRVVLMKGVAERWLQANTKPEYTLQLFPFGREARMVPSLLKAHRDGRARLGSVPPVPDLGVSEGFDAITLWSSNFEGLERLAAYFESRGFETSGVR